MTDRIRIPLKPERSLDGPGLRWSVAPLKLAEELCRPAEALAGVELLRKACGSGEALAPGGEGLGAHPC